MSDSDGRRPDWLGGVTGILTFLGGIALLLVTFRLAFELFSTPPPRALDVGPREPVELNRTAQSLASVVVQILALLAMSVVGSVIANRGIKLYAESRASAPVPPKRPRPEPEPSKVETAT